MTHDMTIELDTRLRYDALVSGYAVAGDSPCGDCGNCERCEQAHEGHDHGLSPDRLDPALSGALPLSAAQDLTGVATLGTLPGTPVLDTGPGFAASFGFAVDVVDQVGGVAQNVLDLFQSITETAMDTWAQVLGGAEGSSIEVEVRVGGTDAVASAGAASLLIDDIFDINGSGIADEGDVLLAITGTLRELQTGVDPNGAAPDIIVNVNEDLVESGAFFLDPELDDTVPAGATDFFSVMLHELGHGLGFAGFADVPGEIREVVQDLGNGPETFGVVTAWDLLIEFDADGTPVFTGENAVALYGEPVPVEFNSGPGSDNAHVLGTTRADGSVTDLALALMNPFTLPGDRVSIGDLELAILADIGHTVERLTGGLVNTLDALPDTALPQARVEDGITLSGGAAFVTVSLSGETPFRTLPSSVAVTLEGDSGVQSTSRISFAPGEAQEAVHKIDLATLFALDTDTDTGRGARLTDTLSVTLFSPAQAVLANGATSQVFSLDLNALVGAAGNDRLDGIAAAETLLGEAGDDTIGGAGGDDLVDAGDGDDLVLWRSGDGSDSLSGGDGLDVLQIDLDAADDVLRLATVADTTVVSGTAPVPFQLDLDGIERIDLTGAEGDDSIDGLAAKLALGLDGGAGADTLIGGGRGDRMTGGAGDDSLDGFAGDDTLEGGDGHDLLAGAGGADLLQAGAGDDIVNAGAGQDIVQGGTGNDTLTGGGQGDDLAAGAGNDLVRGGNGRDTLRGQDGDDRLLGNAAADLILGGDGQDDLRGGAGLDTLSGDAGNDVLRGEGQSDVFVFADGFGQDTIVDFDALDAGEVIDLSALTAITDFADLAADHLSAAGRHVRIDDLSGNSVVLRDVALADLDATDFLF